MVQPLFNALPFMASTPLCSTNSIIFGNLNEKLLDDDLEIEAHELMAEEIKNINLPKMDLNEGDLKNQKIWKNKKTAPFPERLKIHKVAGQTKTLIQNLPC